MPIALPSWFSEIAPIVTAVGVAVGAASLVNTRRPARTTFEDELAKEYRQITRELPKAALLGETLPAEEMDGNLPNSTADRARLQIGSEAMVGIIPFSNGDSDWAELGLKLGR